MPPGFGTGERFPPNKETLPGPGDYDPRQAAGFKADPKFLGQERFNEALREGGEFVDFSPPQKGKAGGMTSEGRKFSWATTRIAELEQELEKSKRRYKELKAQLEDDKTRVEGILTEHASAARQAQRELDAAQGAVKDKDAAAAGLKTDISRLQSELSEAQALVEAGSLKRKQLRAECNDRLQALQRDLDAEKKLYQQAKEGAAAFQAALAQYMGTSDATPADAAGLIDALGEAEGQAQKARLALADSRGELEAARATAAGHDAASRSG
ncbi:hypothetical protein WJX73_003328 [Symbiochloris irregularis]|uniref:Uncharacterized protein n=1 Tax=Symbiochloris irregularis TaxID=706552 RepID=A0AAW1NPD7_9CHLO